MSPPVAATAVAVVAFVVLYALALRRTAGLAVAGSAVAVAAAATTGAAAGLRPWNVAGTALVAAGAAAVAWALGRSQRRRRAEQAALAAYRTGAAAIPRFAALAERDRLAVELHDVAAHRLTAIVVSAAAAQRLTDPDLIADALRHAADAGRKAVAELDRLADQGEGTGGPAAAVSLADVAALATECGAELHDTTDTVPTVPAATVAYRVVREALTNTARYASGAAVRVALGSRPGLLTVTVTDDGGSAAEPDLGTGRGLTGLRGTVGAAGGTLSYGPTSGGWAVHVELPLPGQPLCGPVPGGPRGVGLAWRGTAAERACRWVRWLCPSTLPGRPLSLSRRPAPAAEPIPPCGPDQDVAPASSDTRAPGGAAPSRRSPRTRPAGTRSPHRAAGARFTGRFRRRTWARVSPAGGFNHRPWTRCCPVESVSPRRRVRTSPAGPLWRGPTALDWALVVLAVALSLGAGLLSDDVPDSFRGVLSGLPFVLLSALHAVPLGWRSRAPGAGLTAVLSALVLWWGCDQAGWTRPPVSDIFLVYWWVELTFVYSAGAYLPLRRGVLAPAAVAPAAVAPAAVAATGGLALASGSGITGSRVAAWAALTALLAVPAFALWGLGVRTARLRERHRAATARSRELLARDADAAVRHQRRVIAAGLLRTAQRHTCDVVTAADAGRLDTVLAEARAGLAALRELLTNLRGEGTDGRGQGGDDTYGHAPPPTVAGISALAARYGATVSYRGPRAAEPVVVGVAAYRVAAMLLAEGVTLTVLRGAAGVEVSGPLPAAPGTRRHVRAVADAMGGTLTRTDDAVRVWLPEVFPSRSG
ncbi:histidine kinase [Streptomyces shenzhenensis]|uniref:sensor histidine kinase n=1 Tax=Streptomyces shenzhenensis TaxID=943815 RepID=UPI0011C4258D|nr:histidine kinase [Streptomyces shenzhenensis]